MKNKSNTQYFNTYRMHQYQTKYTTNMKKLMLLLLTFSVSVHVIAQRRSRSAAADTTKPQTVVVTSAFKPALRNSNKVNFIAASAINDSSKPNMLYNVPAQSLFFSYQPVTIKPLAMYIDTAIHWVNKGYIKVGYGNYSTPFVDAGTSFGDGIHSLISVHANHVSSKGQLPFQQFGKTGLDALGMFLSANKKTEWNAKLYYQNATQYLYGFQPSTLVFTKEQLKQAFNSFGGKVGLRNKVKTSFGIDYQPSLDINLFSDNNSGNESSFVLDAPVTKSINNNLDIKVGFTADITSYKSSLTSVNNNIFLLPLQGSFTKNNLKINAGFTPSWDNSLFNMLPNITAEAKIKGEKFILVGGWLGYYQKNTYRHLASQNPWISQPLGLLNTRISEQFAGLKGGAGNHLTYNAKVSVLKYFNMPLFINDNIDGKTFGVIYEPQVNSVRIHAEAGYNEQEKFSVFAGVTINQFSGLTVNTDAFGIVPMELTGTMRWKMLKDLQFKADVFFWDGPKYRNLTDGKTLKNKAAADLNAGIEFTLKPRLNLWLQLNNMLNSRYERWNQYQALGINVLAGVVYSFSQKGK